MPIDNKYGKVTFETPNGIAEDEPIIIFRAQDAALVPTLWTYRYLCEQAGSPEEHLDAIKKVIDQSNDWIENHSSKVPD
jgi:hypothetical protein